MKFSSILQLPILVMIVGSAVPLAGEDPVVGFSQPELDQMLAPIALYPDVLLSQILMASTYPLEVVEASRWCEANPGLEGEAAVEAAQEMDWDSSVKALVAFPDLLKLMDENLAWTQRLGEAFLLQEEDVLATTQSLRRKSKEAGSLSGLAHVSIEEVDDSIVIEPSNVEVVYVPYYRTEFVYGNWWWDDYPPYYWDSPLGFYSRSGFYWSRGFGVSFSFYGSSCDWRRHRVVIHHHRRPDYHGHKPTPDRPGYRYDSSDVWVHDTSHRRGVRYRNPELVEKYVRKRPPNSGFDPGTSRSRVQRNDRDYSDKYRSDRISRTDPTNRSDRISRSDRTRQPEQPSRVSRPDRRSDTNRSDRVARNTSREKRSPSDREQKRDTRSSRSTSSNRSPVAQRPRENRPPSPPPEPKPAVTYDSNRNSSSSGRSSSNWSNNRYSRPSPKPSEGRRISPRSHRDP